jgi:acyl-CoA synthetase (AMP-forming)/AMP-acid ligase II
VPPRSPAEPGQIADWVASRVAPYKRLADVIVVDEVPRSAAGKLLRRVLVERERERAAAAVA